MSQIVKVPNSVLRTQAKPVEKVDKKLLEIIKDMEQTLLKQKDPEGVGIAAPQIGISLQIFFTRPIKEGTKKLPIPKLFINPQITNLSRDTSSSRSKDALLEGCLSMPYYYGHVKRSKSVTVKYQTVENYQLSTNNYQLVDKLETFTGFEAQIVQHEFDHLNGMLFIDRILEQNGELFEVRGEDWKKVDLH